MTEFICKKCGRKVEYEGEKIICCKDCKQEMEQNVYIPPQESASEASEMHSKPKNKVLRKTFGKKKQKDEEYIPCIATGENQQVFVINGKRVVGTRTDDSRQMEKFVENAFRRKYGE